MKPLGHLDKTILRAVLVRTAISGPGASLRDVQIGVATAMPAIGAGDVLGVAAGISARLGAMAARGDVTRISYGTGARWVLTGQGRRRLQSSCEAG